MHILLKHDGDCGTFAVSGVWGAPFASEEEANQFLRLKRQVPYSQSPWEISNGQNAWHFSVAEQVFNFF